MTSPACCSAFVSTLSRWSGSPSRTPVSHVPHVPSRHEDSTLTPAASSAARIETPPGTRTLRQLHVERPVDGVRVGRRRREPLDVQRPRRPARATLFHG
jgi:hypothetical protein